MAVPAHLPPYFVPASGEMPRLTPCSYDTSSVLRRLGPLLASSLLLGVTGCASSPSAGPATSPASATPAPARAAEPRLHELGGSAPDVVEGRDGYLFLGTDFDLSCGSGAEFDDYLAALGRLATVIADSGREVVWTIAPDKSTTLLDRLPDEVPQDACFHQNQQWQEALIGAVEESHYVDSLALLREADAAGDQVYWRGDSHWTSYGASLWLLEMLDRLDPAVVDHVQVTSATADRTGDLYALAKRSDVESAPSASFATDNTSVAVPGPTPFDPGADSWGPLQWRNDPGDDLVPGRTLVVGDSFSYAGIDLAMPLFQRGAFTWFQYFDTGALAREIRTSDTVVIEVAQRTLTHSSIATTGFVDQVETALAR